MADEDKVVAITGGAGGIGLATATRLLARGQRVVVLDLAVADVDRAVTDLSATAAADRVAGFACDTTDEESFRVAMKSVKERFGRLDGMVTAAGVRQTAASALDLDLAVWSNTQAVNVTGTFIAAREAARVMVETGRPGSIVTIASVAGVSARVNQAAYATSKAAVIHLSRGLAVEWAAHHIRVNIVSPGPTKTAMIELAAINDGPGALDDKLYGSLAQFRPGIPLGRLAEPVEQAAAIDFLLSDDASFITGVNLGVDGGSGVV
jgi:NAD(P)-dependent dehydrogenase (short-subunit alcohol dehydrogenase family)